LINLHVTYVLNWYAKTKKSTMAPRKVNMLTAMGFSEQQAKDSLEASGGDVESAVSWAGEVVVGPLG
jgi:uncharacterized UBP type Zn finger protein